MIAHKYTVPEDRDQLAEGLNDEEFEALVIDQHKKTHERRTGGPEA